MTRTASPGLRHFGFARRWVSRAAKVRLILGAVVMLLGAMPLAGAAQAGDSGKKEPAGYREAVGRGLEEFSLGNFEEAREQFTKAHALYPNARTLRGLGFAEFELRHYVEATGYLQQALESDVRRLEGKLRDETVSMLERAREYVGEVELSVSPRAASVAVDGLRGSEAPSKLLLNVGDHVLEFRAEGYAVLRRSIKVRGGRSQRVDVQLSRLVSEDASAATGSPLIPGSSGTKVDQPVYKKWWLWTTVVVVAAGAAVGTALALKANKSTEYRAVPSDNTPTGAGLQPLWVR